MKTRTLGRDLQVSELGYGGMGLSGIYGAADDDASIRVLHRAIELGITLFDTANTYGDGHNERLFGRAFANRRDAVVIATKFGGGVAPSLGRPEGVRGFLEASLDKLATDHVDLYYLHRVDPTTPIEETVGAMAACVDAGLCRHIGLSEASAATIRRAHAVHPVTAVQTEYSLFQRHVEHEILPTLRELGIGFVPYSPLGRGLLGGRITSIADLPEGDWRREVPRFAEDNIAANLRLVEAVRAVATGVGATPAQVALAWLLGQGNDIVPIPGTRRIEGLEENTAAAAVTLGPAEMAALAAAMDGFRVQGERLPAAPLARTQE